MKTQEEGEFLLIAFEKQGIQAGRQGALKHVKGHLISLLVLMVSSRVYVNAAWAAAVAVLSETSTMWPSSATDGGARIDSIWAVAG